jgi:hypothetical protein
MGPNNHKSYYDESTRYGPSLYVRVS